MTDVSTRKGIKKKIVITGAAVVVAAAAAVFFGSGHLNNTIQSGIDTITLEKSDIVCTVNATGTVLSSNSRKVYANHISYPVKEVYVKTGDKVRAGDVLAVLDTASLEAEIRKTELNIKNAQEDLKSADSENLASLQSAKNNVEMAAIELRSKEKKYNEARDLYLAAAITEDELKQAEDAYKKARLSYENALATLKKQQDKSTSSLKIDIDILKNTLENQKRILKEARITSPIDGTVTFVNAREGEPSTGLLFIVEDTDNLVVSSSISEVDINKVKYGQAVTIRSVNTGNKVYTGTVSKIAPGAKRDNTGNIEEDNVLYETEVIINNPDQDIRIGMNVELTINVAEKKDVFKLPREAIYTDNEGNSWIAVLPGGSQSSVLDPRKAEQSAKKVKVSTGLESGNYVEAEAPELVEGLEVLREFPGHLE